MGERAYLSRDALRVVSPIDCGIGGNNFRGEGRQGVVLRNGSEGFEPGQRLQHRVSTELGQGSRQGHPGVGRLDGDGSGQQYRARVEAGIHLHDADAGGRVACHDGALDRCGTAPARQQRCMDVDAAPLRRIERRRREEEPVRGDDEYVEILEPSECVGYAEGRMHGKARGFGKRAHGAGDELAAPARWAVRLGEHRVNRVLRVDQRLQDVDSEAGRTGKTEVQRRTRTSRCCFASFFRMRLRLRFDR